MTKADGSATGKTRFGDLIDPQTQGRPRLDQMGIAIGLFNRPTRPTRPIL
ncbi:MAG: hypothetical protein ABR985_01400 [Methanotrichaceae archaeon]